MKFTRLRLSGFKSFVDPVELYLQEGLTGIVGPNGCGKSNLVEALRWVMGENSAKAMRGGGMDDVIFAGSRGRSARNIAEVTLLVDNAARRAPAAFNDADELEISRRIERESGSAYRINGREARARDVQILFADAATGSHSPSIVSQGRVGQLINAKPKDRRSILESAAGISGLHARRHEAELRLKAAEENLLRLADVMGQIETQLSSLKRQARHALRYQKISAEIRSHEAILLYLRWSMASEQLEKAQADLSEMESQVAALTREAAIATYKQTEASAALPDMRQREAEAAARLHRMTTAIEALEAEAGRVAGQQARLEQQFNEVVRDLEREQTLSTEAEEQLQRLATDMAALDAEGQADGGKLSAAQAEVVRARDGSQAADDALQAVTAELARLRAEAEAQRRRVADAKAREERLKTRVEETGRQLDQARADAPDDAAEREAEARIEAAEAAVLAAEARLEAAAEARTGAQARVEELREAYDVTRAALARLETEEATLSRLLAGGADTSLPAILESVTVRPGFEAALGAALGDDLDVPLADAAAHPAIYWQALPPLAATPALPQGVTALADRVKAPEALARRLSQVGVVEEEEAGAALQPHLAPGQRLVSKLGSLWRWDGFTARHGAPTAAAARLEQKNRLADLARERAQAQKLLEKAEAVFEAARARLREAETAEEESRAAAREAQKAATAARQAAEAARAANADHHRRVELLVEARDRFEAEWKEAAAEHAAICETEDNAEAIAAAESRVEAARGESHARRQALHEAQARQQAVTGEAQIRQHRIASLKREQESWTSRAGHSKEQISRLTTRVEATKAEQQELAAKPAEIARRKQAAEVERAAAETERADAARTLAEQEDLVSAANRALKEVQEKLAEARETRIRLQASLEQITETRRQVAERIDEVLQCKPQQALLKAGVEDRENLPSPAQIEPELDRLKADRERMGPVNLRAEVEAREAEEQLAGMQKERTDLEEAIGRLRQAISSLNREGRERLLKAFELVNGRFTHLFQKLFGGGQAHLALTESDDPLDAGLEIMASPPGKRLQIMSLLSGGEQALTALCLIFAVFQTNPSPICVLDEVDAPLDDANVERLCDLLHEITRETGTRFLVVTHHSLTMSRVNHLYGVTMAERGVSQLVSVDLTMAEDLREAG